MLVTEEFTESLSGQADLPAGIIRGVRLLGPQSSNNRTYPESTLKAAVHHYEGVKVNLDHPKRPQDPRSVRDRIGVIRHARFESGKGIVGDFHFNPKHVVAQQIAWDAQHNSTACGFSHNANLHVSQKAGKQIVESIAGVRSVDLVADPATTGGFFESEQTGPGQPLTPELFAARLRGPRHVRRLEEATEGFRPSGPSMSTEDFLKRLRKR